MTMEEFLRMIGNALLAVIYFFGRLIRDIFLEIWRPIRRTIVRWAVPVIAISVLLFWVSRNQQEAGRLIQSVLALCIMLFGLKIIVSGFFRKGK